MTEQSFVLCCNIVEQLDCVSVNNVCCGPYSMTTARCIINYCHTTVSLVANLLFTYLLNE